MTRNRAQPGRPNRQALWEAEIWKAMDKGEIESVSRWIDSTAPSWWKAGMPFSCDPPARLVESAHAVARETGGGNKADVGRKEEQKEKEEWKGKSMQPVVMRILTPANGENQQTKKQSIFKSDWSSIGLF